jgi:hypothetical protein
MKNTLTTSQAAHLLLQDDNASWSYNGAHALIEFIEEIDDSCDTETELDIVALRCEFTEYDSIKDCMSNYNVSWESELDLEGMDEEEIEEAQLEWLNERTMVIQFEGGIIIQNF